MNKDEGLVRVVGVRGLTAAMINYTVGSGIFVLPALVAGVVGGAAPAVYLVCVIAMGCVVACFAASGSRVSLSGGTYGYAEAAFGPYAGFVVAMSLFVTCILAGAAVMTAFVGTLGKLSPGFDAPYVKFALITVIYAALTIINIRGVKLGSVLVQTVTAAKLIPLLILVGVGLFFIDPHNLAWPGLPASSQMSRASAMLIFAFMGVEGAICSSGEVRDPSKTVPKSILLGLSSVAVLYIAIQVVAQGVLGTDLPLETKAPLAATAKRILGSGGEMLVLIGASISMLGYIVGDVLAAPRVLFALGRDRLLPSSLAAIHPVHKTPHIAIIVYSSICLLLAVTSTFETLLVLAVLSALVVYFICCLAAISLQRKDVRMEGAEPLILPGGPLIPLIAAAIIVWLATSSTQKEFLAMGGMLVVETLLYFVFRLRPAAAVPTPS
jgi:APA family basic amino acid/polyamine antiporter